MSLIRKYIDLIEDASSIKSNSYYHISFHNDMADKTITPKLPDSIIEYLADLKKNPELKNDLEETKTPRFCMAPTLDGCLNGVGHLIRLLNEYPFLTFYIYTNKNTIHNFYDWDYLNKNKMVFDAYITKEIWVLEPLKLDLLGSFNLTPSMIVGTKEITPFDDPNRSSNSDRHYNFINLPEFK